MRGGLAVSSGRARRVSASQGDKVDALLKLTPRPISEQKGNVWLRADDGRMAAHITRGHGGRLVCCLR